MTRPRAMEARERAAGRVCHSGRTREAKERLRGGLRDSQSPPPWPFAKAPDFRVRLRQRRRLRCCPDAAAVSPIEPAPYTRDSGTVHDAPVLVPAVPIPSSSATPSIPEESSGAASAATGAVRVRHLAVWFRGAPSNPRAARSRLRASEDGCAARLALWLRKPRRRAGSSGSAAASRRPVSRISRAGAGRRPESPASHPRRTAGAQARWLRTPDCSARPSF